MEMKRIAFYIVMIVILLMIVPVFALAYDGHNGTLVAAAYRVGEQTAVQTADSNASASDVNEADDPANDQNEGPVRMARFSYVSGNVSWRPSEGDNWSPATINQPIRQDAQVWVTEGGRAEVQFDDGSLLRLGNGGLAVLQTLYSDDNGEFTEIRMAEGVSSLRLRNPGSVYQIDTPSVSIQAEGPAQLRVGVDDGVEIGVNYGQAAVTGDSGSVELNAGNYLDIRDADSKYQIESLPAPDSWDDWNQERDGEYVQSGSLTYLPPNISLVAGNIDNYGTWEHDANYGWVWCPSGVSSDWRPYEYGRWVWVSPFGWTWVSDEVWGWAPYHYGTWVRLGYGWAWVPGPATQYWCPGVVSFTEYDGSVYWVSLAPWEVHYPSRLGIGFRKGNWSLFFSIGGCAVYYPHGTKFCEPRPWHNRVINRAHIRNVTNVYRNPTTITSRNVYLQKNFIPGNSKQGGVMSALVASFGGRGRYTPEPRTDSMFEKGRGIGAPPIGTQPKAGPIATRPTTLGFNRSRTYMPETPAPQVLQRPVVRGRLPDDVARIAPPINPATQQPNSPGQAAQRARESLGWGNQAGGRGTYQPRPNGNTTGGTGGYQPLQTGDATGNGTYQQHPAGNMTRFGDSNNSPLNSNPNTGSRMNSGNNPNSGSGMNLGNNPNSGAGMNSRGNPNSGGQESKVYRYGESSGLDSRTQSGHSENTNRTPEPAPAPSRGNHHDDSSDDSHDKNKR